MFNNNNNNINQNAKSRDEESNNSCRKIKARLGWQGCLRKWKCEKARPLKIILQWH